jgi:spermidine synthase
MTKVAPDLTRAQLGALQSIFAISGVCGLIYESIWSHYLKLFVGHAAYAQTVVLIVFIGGMALGAALIGRYSARIRSPLVGYAVAEALIGVVSLVFHRLFVASTDWAYAWLLPAACVPESPCVAQWVFAALLILPQSILLGTTFPLMTGGILRIARHDPGRRIALLYFLNSIGAAVGVLLAGFVLIPAVGLPGTLLTAGLANLVVAFAAWGCARRTESAPLVSEATIIATPGAPPRRVLIVVAALTGLSSFIYEIMWIRMLSLIVGASTHAFELMLAAFIFGLAFGGLWVRKRIDGFRDLIATLAIVQVLMGIAAIGTLALYDGMFDVMGWLLSVLRRGESGYIVYNAANHAFALAIMLPATFLAGMTFPLITTALFRGRDGEKAIGYTYAANTFGSIVGVVLAVHFAMPMLGMKGGLLFAAAVDIALGVGLLCARQRSGDVRQAIGLGAAGTAALLVVTISVPMLPERLASGVYRSGRAKLEADRQIVYHRDGKTASVTVYRTAIATTIATNGKPDASIGVHARHASSDEVTMVMTGLLPLAYKPEAKTAAVIGFGSGLTTATLLGSPHLKRVDTIEIEPRMVEGARLFGSIVEAAYVDPRSRIVIDDAKSYFARSDLRYDLIVSEPSNPWVSGVASLFTREFYARAKRQLNAGGLFVQWIHVYEFNDRLLATIMRALSEEFNHYEVYASNDGDLIVVASQESLASGPQADFRDWTGLSPLLERVQLQSVDELNIRRLAGRKGIEPLLRVFGEGVNSDYFPLVDQSAPKARFAGDVAGGLMRTVTAPVPVIELAGDSLRSATTLGDRAISPPLRVSMAASAREAREFLRAGTTAEAPAPDLLRALGFVRAALWDCARLPARAGMRELMLPLATVINPVTERRDATAFWNEVRSAPCATKLDPTDRDWIDLFAAVAARDASTMAALGQQLAGGADVPDPLRAYAVMTGAAGLIASNRHAEASRFLTALSGRLSPAARDDPPLRLLSALAHAEIARQALLAR